MLVSNARAQGLPSAVDLRAAYCIPILQESLSEALSLKRNAETYALSGPQKEVVEKTLSETATNLRRLQLYLLPRLSYLDPYGIEAAQQSGNEDYARHQENAKACDTKCYNIVTNNPYEHFSCVLQCNSDSPLRARTSVCADLSWLPF